MKPRLGMKTSRVKSFLAGMTHGAVIGGGIGASALGVGGTPGAFVRHDLRKSQKPPQRVACASGSGDGPVNRRTRYH